MRYFAIVLVVIFFIVLVFGLYSMEKSDDFSYANLWDVDEPYYPEDLYNTYYGGYDYLPYFSDYMYYTSPPPPSIDFI